VLHDEHTEGDGDGDGESHGDEDECEVIQGGVENLRAVIHEEIPGGHGATPREESRDAAKA